MNVKAIKNFYQQMEKLKKDYEKDMQTLRDATVECGAIEVHQHHNHICVQVDEQGLKDVERDIMENVEGYHYPETPCEFWHIDFTIDGVHYNYTKSELTRLMQREG